MSGPVVVGGLVEVGGVFVDGPDSDVDSEGGEEQHEGDYDVEAGVLLLGFELFVLDCEFRVREIGRAHV